MKRITVNAGFEVSVMELYNGHRSLYAKLQIFGQTFWLQRWDTERATNNRFLNADGSMGWTWGHRS